MQSMLQGLGSGGLILTRSYGIPLPVAAAFSSAGRNSAKRSITPRISSCGWLCGMSRATADTSTTSFCLSTPSVKSLKYRSLIVCLMLDHKHLPDCLAIHAAGAVRQPYGWKERERRGYQIIAGACVTFAGLGESSSAIFRARRETVITFVDTRRASGMLAVLLLAAAALVHAAEPSYPTRPVRLIVGFPPGGSTDALARIITPKLGDAMGQNWIVDNRGGAGGNDAAEMAAHANPDGHTVFLALSTQLTASPSLYKLPFNVEKDLQPITTLATHEHIVLVHPNVPVKTLKELIALAKQKPGALNYASSGVGGSLHLAAELLKRRAGFEMVHI